MKIEIRNHPLYEGVYDFDPYAMTMRQRHRVKEICGLSGMSVYKALMVEDTDLLVALAAVAIEAEKGGCDVDQLWDTEGLAIILDYTDEAKEAGTDPPALGPSVTSSSREH